MRFKRYMGSRKGQIAGQIFIYIMAAVIIGVIALIGYKAIIIIMDKTCNAERISFETKIKSTIEESNSFGSISPESMRAPCDYDTVCFVSAQDIIELDPQGFDCPNAIIEDSVVKGVRQNIFLVSADRTIQTGYSDLVSLNLSYVNKCMCVKERNGNFNLRFTGKGSSTEINAR